MKTGKIYNRRLYIIGFIAFSLFIFIGLFFNERTKTENDIFNGEIAFRDTIHDFGVTDGNDTLHSYKFIFMNVGKVPVSILSTRTSCDCTTATFSDNIIYPGDTGCINVCHKTYPDFSGQYIENIQVRINSERIHILSVTGSVK